MRRIALLFTAAAVLAPTIASASETITYSYDAKGRLTQVAHAGGPADRVVSTYQFDAADNRTVASVAGAAFDSASARLIVLPLAGMPLLILPTNS